MSEITVKRFWTRIAYNNSVILYADLLFYNLQLTISAYW